MNKFILNADDFGLSEENNQAVADRIDSGILTGASLCTNSEYFSQAIKIANTFPNLSLAIHLNIVEGKSLIDCNLLTDKNGYFNKNYLYFLLNQTNKKLIKQIELEFNAQIQKAVNLVKIDNLDSHVHIHSIPVIFDITCCLAKKYNIKFVRTQQEKIYFVKKRKTKIINLIKNILLKILTFYNIKTLNKYNLKTNDYLLGVCYTGEMDIDTVKQGLKKMQNVENKTVECLIHPCKYKNDIQNSHTIEFEITQIRNLKKFLSENNFILTNFQNF